MLPPIGFGVSRPSNLTSMRTPLRKLAWLGVLVVSAATTVVASDGQVVFGSPGKQLQYEWQSPAFGSSEDNVDQLVENGRRLMTTNGQTCTHPRLEHSNGWLIF